MLADRASHALADLEDLDRAELGKHEDELLPPIPRHDIAAPGHLGQPSRGLAQHRVACGVTVGVVDLLEMIEIDHDQAERPLGAHRAVGLEFHDLFEEAAVVQPGQAVADRQALLL